MYCLEIGNFIVSIYIFVMIRRLLQRGVSICIAADETCHNEEKCAVCKHVEEVLRGNLGQYTLSFAVLLCILTSRIAIYVWSDFEK